MLNTREADFACYEFEDARFILPAQTWCYGLLTGRMVRCIRHTPAKADKSEVGVALVDPAGKSHVGGAGRGGSGWVGPRQVVGPIYLNPIWGPEALLGSFGGIISKIKARSIVE